MRGRKTRHRTTAPVSLAKLERSLGYAPITAEKVKGLDRPARILYCSRRIRLLDPDNLCGKYVTDALVSCGLLQDDTAKWIKAITHEQEKIS